MFRGIGSSHVRASGSALPAPSLPVYALVWASIHDKTKIKEVLHEVDRSRSLARICHCCTNLRSILLVLSISFLQSSIVLITFFSCRLCCQAYFHRLRGPLPPCRCNRALMRPCPQFSNSSSCLGFLLTVVLNGEPSKSIRS